MKNPKILRNGLIVLGDLLVGEKYKDLSIGLILMGTCLFVKKNLEVFHYQSHCNGWPTQLKSMKIFQLV